MSNSKAEQRSAKVVARVPEAIKSRWQNAATMRGQTLTDFLIVAANNATDEIFEMEEKIELSERDQKLFMETMMNPPELTDIMKAALSQRMEQIRIG